MSTPKVNIGIIGCGRVSRTYFENCSRFAVLNLAACADLDMQRAGEMAGQYGITAYSVEELLADPDIELVINLSIPHAHAEIALAAIAAGKSVYNEKPLAINCREGKQILEAARGKGVLVGGAPDTFLGAGLQTCRRLIDEGAIGTPIAANAFMLNHGHEHWHPDPDFFYQPGAGPLFDMGPYYLTALVSLLGSVLRVTGSAIINFPRRTITSQPRYGEQITVNTPTHIAAVLDFANGAIGTLVTSFDVWASELPCIEIYGTEGTLSVPDPNTFGGPVRLYSAGTNEWATIPLTSNYSSNSRGIGVADMATALRTGRTPRASGELAYHVLEIMCGIQKASLDDMHTFMLGTCERPAPLPANLTEFVLDE